MPGLNGPGYSFAVGLILVAFSLLAFALDQIKFGDQDITLIIGIANRRDLPTRDIGLSGCSALGPNYGYLQINGIPGEACIGWELFPNCGIMG